MSRIQQAFLVVVMILITFFSCGLQTAEANDGIEEILDYKSDIAVHSDSSMTVTETITVNALGREIRHGIYRDFPTDYKDKYGNRYKVRFQVQSVTMDGSLENFFTEKRMNGVRVYIGDSNIYVTPGVHTYAITYQVGRVLGFFKDHDELYWNVTGNGWVFPIRKASAVIKLPAGVPDDQIRVAGFTGVYGSTEQAYTATIDADRNVIFNATRLLNSFEGLTIVVSWPKGYVTEPDLMTRFNDFLQDNRVYILLFLGLLAVFLYYLIVWDRYGRDPAKGTIMPIFHPPGNLSPAAARFIRKMDFDTKTLTSAVIRLAVRGAVEIHQNDGQYSLRRKDVETSGFAPEESAVYFALPSEGVFTLTNTHYHEVERLINACRQALEAKYEGSYFIRNKGYLIAGIVLSALVCGGIFLMEQASAALVVAGICFVMLHLVFYFLLKAPTLVGRRVLDQIDGFRMFLATAEKDRLNTLYPSGRTPQLFEEYLPYALALDVEQAWSERFDDVFAQAGMDGQPYHPGWYYGSGWSHHHPAQFASSLGSSFSHAISSSATPPGSSSGSGGGGFSGGGGGGGGGGGW